MSISSQPQPPAGELVYPNTVSRPPPYSPSFHSSDGSFGTVLIVLAVIVVISVVASCFGRLCTGRSHKHKPHKQSHSSHPRQGQGGNMEFQYSISKQQSRSFRPREREIDIEFGFDKNIAASKPAGNGQNRGFKQSGNRDIKFEPKLGGA